MRCRKDTLVEYIYQIVSQEIHQELWFHNGKLLPFYFQIACEKKT